jgi:bacteriocin biosynthesis cyclodehydratase domain-containing protein
MTRSLERPVLLPGLTRAWRDRNTLQLGVAPGRAVLVELADPGTARLLDLLDGRRTEPVVVRDAHRLGIPAAATRTVLHTLRCAGLVVTTGALLPEQLTGSARTRLASEGAALALRVPGVQPTPAAVLRGRQGSSIVLAGRSRLAAPVALALAQAGVGHLHVDVSGTVTAESLGGSPLTPDDVGQPAAAAIIGAVLRAAPETRTGAVRRGHATLVVQFPAERPAVLTAAGHGARAQPYLNVAVRDGTPVVGPLVRPGRPPCLTCLDLHRRDRDAGWAALSGQLGAQPGTAGGEPLTATTALAAAALVTAEALAHVDGERPETLGATIEVDGPHRLRRRSWPAHPSCGCERAAAPGPRQ